MSLGAAALVGDAWGWGAGFNGFGWQTGSCRLQCAMDGDSGGAACPQDTDLLSECRV